MSSSATSSTTAAIKQNVRQVITSNISQYFSGTLGQVTDIVNIVMALVQRESSFNYYAIGPIVPTSTSSGARDYYNSTPVQNVLQTGTVTQRSLVIDGQRAWGLMQVMGWNVLKGCSKVNNACLIEQYYPNLVGILVQPAGSDLSDTYNGPATVNNQILAGLAVLDSKYKYVNGSGTSWVYGKSTAVFSSKIAASVGAYLGATRDVVTGVTPQQYVGSIMYGASYIAANGSAASGTAVAGSTNSGPTNPTVSVASGNTQYPVGC